MQSLELMAPLPRVHNIHVDGYENDFAEGVLVHNKTAMGGCSGWGAVVGRAELRVLFTTG